jgi:ATP/maltotriose-dependent transcriptional regulator MalT
MGEFSTAPQAAIAQARAALDAGEFSRADSLLRSAPHCADRFLLSALIARQLQKPNTVLSLLEEGRRAGFFDAPAERVFAAALIAGAHVELGATDAAAADLQSAVDLFAQSPNDETNYYIAFAYWMLGQSSEAAALLQRRTPSAPAMRAQYLFLRGFIFAQREQFSEQAVATRNALTLLLEHTDGQDLLLAKTAHALASLAREVPMPSVLELVTQAYDRVRWNEHLSHERFQILRAIGWTHALNGTYPAAYKALALARTSANTAGQRALAHLDHAFVADFAGERNSFKAELDFAESECGAIDWSQPCHDEELACLISAAELHAMNGNQSRAEHYLAQAHEHRSQISRRLALSQGRRLDALIAAAASRVYQVSDVPRACAEAETAFKAFDGLSYLWRAARVALEMHTMTSLPRWLERAQERTLLHYPHSCLADEVRRRIAMRVTPSQDRVLQLLLAGYCPAEIAKQLGIVEGTTRHHIQKLFRSFGVNNVYALLARARAIEPPRSAA